MFNFFHKYGKYSKIDTPIKLKDVEKFFSEVETCNLFKSDRNPIRDRSNEVSVLENASIQFKGDSVQVKDRIFPLVPNPFDVCKTFSWLGSDLVVSLPRGYEGDCTYYRIEKVN